VVEASYVATERIEESISHQVSPNVDEVLASGRVSTDTSRSVFEASSLLQFALVYRISRLLTYLLTYFEYLHGVYLEKALKHVNTKKSSVLCTSPVRMLKLSRISEKTLEWRDLPL
jgi:hypothetical protein